MMSLKRNLDGCFQVMFNHPKDFGVEQIKKIAEHFGPIASWRWCGKYIFLSYIEKENAEGFLRAYENDPILQAKIPFDKEIKKSTFLPSKKGKRTNISIDRFIDQINNIDFNETGSCTPPPPSVHNSQKLMKQQNLSSGSIKKHNFDNSDICQINAHDQENNSQENGQKPPMINKSKNNPFKGCTEKLCESSFQQHVDLKQNDDVLVPEKSIGLNVTDTSLHINVTSKVHGLSNNLMDLNMEPVKSRTDHSVTYPNDCPICGNELPPTMRLSNGFWKSRKGVYKSKDEPCDPGDLPLLVYRQDMVDYEIMERKNPLFTCAEVVLSNLPIYLLQCDVYKLCNPFSNVLHVDIWNMRVPTEETVAHVYVQNDHDAIYLIESLNKRVVFGKLLSAVRGSDYIPRNPEEEE